MRGELRARGIRFVPHVWLATEWFSPTGIGGFAIPFWLAHPRLARLERAHMGSVEGGTVRECMMILRHEAGHAIQHAYALHRRAAWRRAFGRHGVDYPDRYRPARASRHFVRHLPGWYAQAHPDEDFAETFAVWLDPRSDWRRRYARWPAALAKLETVDALARAVAACPPPRARRETYEPLAHDGRTLGALYAERRHRERAVRGSGWLPL